MATLNIDGRAVNVDDSFLKLSPEDQNATVDEIHKSLSAGAPQAPVPLGQGIVGAATDVPIVGPLLRKANAAIDAATAPSLGYKELPEPTFGERYQNALKRLEQPLAQFSQERPGIDLASRLVSTGLATGGLGSTVAGARLLGMVGQTLPTQMAAGAASGAGISAADAALRGQDIGPAALLGGAFGAAGPVVSRGVAAALPGAAKAAVPTVEELKTAARGGYQHPEVAAIQIKPQAVSNLGAQIENDLIRGPGAGFRPNTTPKTFGIVNEMNVPVGTGAVNMGDIQSIKQALGNVAREVDAVGRPTPESAAASRAMKGLDGFLDNLRQPDLVAGDASRAVPILRDAGKNWGAAMRAEDLGVRLTRAERQAAKSGSGSNIQNAIKQKVSAVLDVPQRSVGYSSAEKAAAEAVVRGSASENALRKFGKLGFGDGLSLLLHAGATLPSGGANIPIGIAGTFARKAAERMTMAKAAALEEMLRARSPLAQQRSAAMPIAPPRNMAPLRTLLQAQAVRGAQPLYFPP